MKIGVLSDTHGYVPRQVFSFFDQCDELWHAGDCGPGVLEQLKAFKPVRAVYGNIDSHDLRYEAPRFDSFVCQGQRVLLTHIGGWPGHYPADIKAKLAEERPDIFVCGHSHILKIMYDPQYHLLHINPGAAGRTGFHKVCTLVRFELNPEPCQMEYMEYAKNPTDA